jgi:hypothetical protein
MYMNKKIKVTVRFTTELKNLMIQAIINDGYGLHGKSKWASEAIEQFVTMDYMNLVDIGSEMSGGELKETESFYLPYSTVDILEKIAIDVRLRHPQIDGIKSIVIRTGIFQKLFRSKKTDKEFVK